MKRSTPYILGSLLWGMVRRKGIPDSTFMREWTATLLHWLRFKWRGFCTPCVCKFGRLLRRLDHLRHRLAVGGFLLFIDYPEIRNLFGRLVGIKPGLDQETACPEAEALIQPFLASKGALK